MRGEVVYFYAFDVANEIVFERVRTVRGMPPQPFPLRTGHGTPKDIPFRAPLAVEPHCAIEVHGRPARLQVRIYSVGVVSIVLHVPVEVTGLSELIPFHHPTLADGRPLNEFASTLCAEIFAELTEALVRPSTFIEPEAYTAFFFSDLGGEQDTAVWLAARGRDVAGLLADTPADRLSEAQVGEILRQQRSFERTDLVVVDWDAALVVDLDSPVDDVLFVLELANLQLEEFRMMDQTLDRYLNAAYEDLEARPVTLFGIASSVLRKLRQFRVDVTKLADEVTHITKLFGDWHLARVYLLARERFHLDQWRASVEGRLAQLDRLYTVVHTDLNERRMFWLEVIIVVFFAIDIVVLFMGKK
jgi:hypothetical protein